MKKIYLLYAALFLVLLGACKKDSAPATPTVSNWVVNNYDYKALQTVWSSGSTSGLMALSDTFNTDGSCIVLFNSRPTHDKTYIIGSTLDSNTVEIGFYDMNNILFVSNGGNLVVTLNNSKIVAKFTNIPVVNNQGLSSGNANGTLIEQ